jgi:hypothetical protein
VRTRRIERGRIALAHGMNVDGMLARRHSLERELEQTPAGVCNRETVGARRDTRIIPRWNRTAATSQRLASISAGSDVQSGCHAMKKPKLFRVTQSRNPAGIVEL